MDTVIAGTPGYVAPEQYRPIVDAQLAAIEAYLAVLSGAPETLSAPAHRP